MDKAKLFEAMLGAMVGSETPVARHTHEVRAGDVIDHGGAVVTVTEIRHNALHRNWRLDIRCHTTGSVNWVYYPDTGTVKRYE